MYIKRREERKILWNAWFDKKTDKAFAFEPVPILKPNANYLLVLDLSGIPYDTEQIGVTTQSVSPSLKKDVADWIKDQTLMPDALEILLLHDESYLEKPQKSLQKLQISIEKISNKNKPVAKPFQIMRAWDKENKDGLPEFVYGRIFFHMKTTEKEGKTSIGLSVWANNRPVDELSIRVCIASEQATTTQCEGLLQPQFSLKGIDSLRVGAKAEAFPDAALHFLVKDPEEGVIGVFRQNEPKKDDKPNKSDQQAESEFTSWRLRISADELKRRFEQTLIPNIESAFTDYAVENEKVTLARLKGGGDDIYNTLFPIPEGNAARMAFQNFISPHLEKDPLDLDYLPPSIFVRMVLPGPDPPLPIPLGLMVVNEKFLGYYFRIETPLEIQNYQAGRDCISDWFLVAPPENGHNDNPLKDAFQHANETIADWKTTVQASFERMGDFDPWIRGKAVVTGEKTEASALIVLSHHAKDTLYFNKTTDGEVTYAAVQRNFHKPSVVILDGCGTGGGGALAFLRAFNKTGFATVIALSTQVGPKLAGDYLVCLATELNNNRVPSGSIPLSLIHFNTLKCLRQKTPFPDATQYGPRVLAYSLLGNGNIRLCPPKKEAKP